MIFQYFRSHSQIISPRQNLYLYLILFCILFLVSFASLSCNNPFQPEIEYTPKLNVYSVLFAEQQAVYVRVTSVMKSPSDVSQPVHGASVSLSGNGQYVNLVDTTAVIDGDTVSFYFAPFHITSGGNYSIHVFHDGYPPVSARVTIPVSYIKIQNWGSYSGLLSADEARANITFKVNMSGLTRAAFIQMFLEYRGLDASGKFHVGAFNVTPVDSLNPFKELETTTLQVSVDATDYNNALKIAKRNVSKMKVAHLYAGIVVTQIDDNLYRFFITSNRSLNPLVMRTDKIIFSNIMRNSGTGIIAGAAVDTTRIILF